MRGRMIFLYRFLLRGSQSVLTSLSSVRMLCPVRSPKVIAPVVFCSGKPVFLFQNLIAIWNQYELDNSFQLKHPSRSAPQGVS